MEAGNEQHDLCGGEYAGQGERRVDDLAVQTFYLTNVSQQRMTQNEIMVAIRNLLDPGLKIYLVASQNALIIRGRRMS